MIGKSIIIGLKKKKNSKFIEFVKICWGMSAIQYLKWIQILHFQVDVVPCFMSEEETAS